MGYIVQIAIDALSLGSLYALAALGIGLLFGVLRLINFAHGDFITLGAYALIAPAYGPNAIRVIADFHPVLLVICTILVVVAIALLSELVVFRPLRYATAATLMVGSFALSFVIQNLIIMIYSGRPKSLDLWSVLTEIKFGVGGVDIALLPLLIIAVTLILMVLLVLFLKRTPWGVQMRAAAEDFKMARMLGVRANFVISLAFVLSGALAAIVSLLFEVQTGILMFRMGTPLMVFAFIATVIGGMGSLVGSVVGGFSVGIVSSILQAALPSEVRGYRDVFVFGLVIFTLLARPEGIVLSRAARERV
jgi:branched-chain amino acid transport system permease protein